MKLIELPTHSDARGDLTVIESCLPFMIRRVFFITKPVGVRGGHYHIKTVQALICLQGSILIELRDDLVRLDDKRQCMILQPSDWHSMYEFSEDCILLVLASEHYSENDYVRD